MVGILPNDASILRLVGSQLLEQQEEWQLERRRFFSEATMTKLPESEKPLELADGAGAYQSATASNRTAPAFSSIHTELDDC